MAKKKKRKVKGGGNFRRPTPARAEKYLARKEREGILKASDIVDEDKKQQAVERTRFREALNAWRDYNRRLEAYENAKAEAEAAYVAAIKDWSDAKKKGLDVGKKPAKSKYVKDYMEQKGVRVTKPSKTHKAKHPKLKGNFKKMSQKGAKQYLARVFRKLTTGRMTSESDLQRYLKRAPVKVYGGGDNRLWRIQEAVHVVGIPEALRIKQRADEAAAKKARQLAEKLLKKEKRLEGNVQKAQEKLDKVQQRLADLRQERAAIGQVATAARKRRARMRKKLKRAKKARAKRFKKKRSRRKSRRGRKMRKSRKSRKSRKRSRRKRSRR